MGILKIRMANLVGKKAILLLLSFLISFSIAGCGSTKTIAPPSSSDSSTFSEVQEEKIIKVPVFETEQFIEANLREKVGADTKVTCPQKMEGQIGDFFICLVENLSIPSDSHFADVQIMNELGEISYLVRRD